MDADKVQEQNVGKTEENKDDWRDNRSLSGCAEHYLQKGIETDVDFIFRKHGDRKLKAHRLILSMRSAVFEAMFFGPMADNKKEIDIEDVEPDIFDLMLRYIYTDKVDLNGETVLKCLNAGRKYCLSGLVNLCSSFLENSISPENVCTIYEQARFFDVEDLSTRCYSFITQNSEAVFQSEDIMKLSSESIFKLVSDENLQSEEILHFEMVLRWADAKCQSEKIEPSVENKRKVLGNIFDKIRFPMIPLEVFVGKVVPTNILLQEDLVQLLQFMVTMKTDTPGHVGRFSSFPRHNILTIDPKIDVCSCALDDNREAVQICSNCNIALVSFVGCFGFSVCELSCQEDGCLNRQLKYDFFDFADGELRTKRTAGGQIILEANKSYMFCFRYGMHQPYVTSRTMNQVIRFGELSITIKEMPSSISKIKFYRV